MEQTARKPEGENIFKQKINVAKDIGIKTSFLQVYFFALLPVTFLIFFYNIIICLITIFSYAQETGYAWYTSFTSNSMFIYVILLLVNIIFPLLLWIYLRVFSTKFIKILWIYSMIIIVLLLFLVFSGFFNIQVNIAGLIVYDLFLILGCILISLILIYFRKRKILFGSANPCYQSAIPDNLEKEA